MSDFAGLRFHESGDCYAGAGVLAALPVRGRW